jgi:hypothetical protein
MAEPTYSLLGELTDIGRQVCSCDLLLYEAVGLTPALCAAFI